jgi:beta-aspartyl-peptidase (threonine type)
MRLTMTSPAPSSHERPAWRLLVHGGCGIIERGSLSPEQDRAARAALEQALAAGSAVLAQGGPALDAVEAAVRILEDDPHFNAGRGAVFTYDATIEHDAAIMEGTARRAGSVTGTTCTRHPVSLARKVMEASPHVFLRGLGADAFSREQGLEQVENAWFHTPERRRQLEEFRNRPDADSFDIDLKYGTGTYADDRACAVSATGAGEFFIREGVAHEICARLRFTQDGAQAAADIVMDEMRELGGTGGVIMVTPAGEAVYSFNTPGMYRGEASPAGRSVAIYGDE